MKIQNSFQRLSDSLCCGLCSCQEHNDQNFVLEYCLWFANPVRRNLIYFIVSSFKCAPWAWLNIPCKIPLALNQLWYCNFPFFAYNPIFKLTTLNSCCSWADLTFSTISDSDKNRSPWCFFFQAIAASVFEEFFGALRTFCFPILLLICWTLLLLIFLFHYIFLLNSSSRFFLICYISFYALFSPNVFPIFSIF